MLICPSDAAELQTQSSLLPSWIEVYAGSPSKRFASSTVATPGLRALATDGSRSLWSTVDSPGSRFVPWLAPEPCSVVAQPSMRAADTAKISLVMWVC